jgi:hypothetical protein
MGVTSVASSQLVWPEAIVTEERGSFKKYCEES